MHRKEWHSLFSRVASRFMQVTDVYLVNKCGRTLYSEGYKNTFFLAAADPTEMLSGCASAVAKNKRSKLITM